MDTTRKMSLFFTALLIISVMLDFILKIRYLELIALIFEIICIKIYEKKTGTSYSNLSESQKKQNRIFYRIYLILFILLLIEILSMLLLAINQT